MFCSCLSCLFIQNVAESKRRNSRDSNNIGVSHPPALNVTLNINEFNREFLNNTNNARVLLHLRVLPTGRADSICFNLTRQSSSFVYEIRSNQSGIPRCVCQPVLHTLDYLKLSIWDMEHSWSMEPCYVREGFSIVSQPRKVIEMSKSTTLSNSLRKSMGSLSLLGSCQEILIRCYICKYHKS